MTYYHFISYILGGESRQKIVWAKSPDKAERALLALFPNAYIIGMVED